MLDGIYTQFFSAENLSDLAEVFERKIHDAENIEDKRWFQSRADRLRALAIEKGKSLEPEN